MSRFTLSIFNQFHIFQKLFVADPEKRLGGGPDDGKELRAHPWFAGVDWDQIYNKQIKPPFKPRLGSDTDVRYIDSAFTDQKVGESPESAHDSLPSGGDGSNK